MGCVGRGPLAAHVHAHVQGGLGAVQRVAQALAEGAPQRVLVLCALRAVAVGVAQPLLELGEKDVLRFSLGMAKKSGLNCGSLPGRK